MNWCFIFAKRQQLELAIVCHRTRWHFPSAIIHKMVLLTFYLMTTVSAVSSLQIICGLVSTYIGKPRRTTRTFSCSRHLSLPCLICVAVTVMAKRKTLYGNNREIVTIAIVSCFCISLVLDYSECLTIGRCFNLLW